tara:strand:- start:2011 stop:2625 length:615 start_codon:yes stop_codon:yes gene_type:complete
MPLTPEQVSQLKEQLKSQVQNLEPEQKAEAETQIAQMSPEALETMLQQQQSQQSSIFRQIVNKEIDSVQVGENPEAIAVLDINPISKGHTMIIPKTAVQTPDKIPKSAFDLAQDISKKIISNLKAKSTKTETQVQFGEAIIHIIPIYDKDLSLESQRSKASPQDLQEIKTSLETIVISKKPEKIKITKKKSQKKKPLKLKRAIP